jgi:hypothetical protein
MTPLLVLPAKLYFVVRRGLNQSGAALGMIGFTKVDRTGGQRRVFTAE